MTSHRTTLLLSLCGLLLAMACDPARDGYFHGDYPEGPAIDVTPTGAADFGISSAECSNHRRWAPFAEVWGLGGNPIGNGSPHLQWGWFLPTGRSLEWFEYYSGPLVTLGLVKGIPDYVFVENNQHATVQPVGPSGPSLALGPGYHILRRACNAGTPNEFAEVPGNTKLTYDPVAAQMTGAGLDPHLEACGGYVAPQIDVGTQVGILPPPSARFDVLPVTDIAWSPASDAFYLLVGYMFDRDVQVLGYRLGAAQLAQVGFGDYVGPLEVATGGTSILVTSVPLEWDSSSYTYRHDWSYRYRLSLGNAPVSGQARLPMGNHLRLGTRPVGLLSPDGRLLAIEDPNSTDHTVDIIDVAGAVVVRKLEANGTPLAWDPTSTVLLVASPYATEEVQLLPADGSPAVALPLPRAPYVTPAFSVADGRQDRVFWTASGPKALIQGGLAEDDVGVRVYDFMTGQTTIFVDPQHEARPGASIAAVIATEQAFAWSVQCLGLAETFCTSELRRLSLATGAIDVVARADGALRFAVSPDGAKLALVHGDGIYLKVLTP